MNELDVLQEMEEITKQDRQRWWLLCYGLTAMQKASITARQLVGLCNSNRDPLFLPLAVATHTFYARPFMDNKGVGRIEDSIIPARASGIHDWLMTFRCKAYCHTDAKNVADTGIPWNDVVYEIDDGINEITTKTPCAQISNYAEAIDHFDTMHGVIFREIRMLEETYCHLIPKDSGHYELRVDMPLKKLFIPHTPCESSTLNFK